MPSMSRKGNCHDNAMMESFWSNLKRELIHVASLPRVAIFEWIEVFYKRVRLQSAPGFKSSVDFETQLN